MALRISAAIEGRLSEYMAAEQAAVLRSSEEAVRASTVQLKNDVRAEINRAFQGSARVAGGNRRVANAVRDKYFTNKDGTLTGLVYSKFGTRGPNGEFIDYLLPHATGATIRPRDAQMLFISLLPGSRASSRRARLERELARNGERIAFIQGQGGKVYVVKKFRHKTELLGIMVRSVTLPRRLDFERVTKSAGDDLAQRLIVALERADVRVAPPVKGGTSRFVLRSSRNEFLGRI